MKTYLFAVVIEDDPFEDGTKAYHAFCPALKGAGTWGYSREEALRNIREVLEMTVESMMKRGEEIPESASVEILSEPKVAVTI